MTAQTALMHREFGRAESQWKADGTRVTAVDLAISEGIFAQLGSQFPGDQFFSEETAHVGPPIPVTSKYAWILDPIDGTNNYAAGIAHCAIGLGLFVDGQPAYGFVYDLARRCLMHGGPGFGVWDGERSAQVKLNPPDSHSLIGFHTPMEKCYLPEAGRLLRHFKIRGLGSSTLHLAYVAVGLLEGVVDHNVKIWDIAGALPLLIAGGGEVHFLNGAQLPIVAFDLKMGRIRYVAGGAAMSARLLEVLADGSLPSAEMRSFGE